MVLPGGSGGGGGGGPIFGLAFGRAAGGMALTGVLRDKGLNRPGSAIRLLLKSILER